MAKSVPGPTDTTRTPQTVQDGTSALATSPPPSVTYSETIWDIRVKAQYAVPSQADVLAKASEFLILWESVDETPEWPGGSSSGVTWGVGWDAGQHSAAELTGDWAELNHKILNRLKKAIGKRGEPARKLAEELSDVTIPEDVSVRVFKKNTLPLFYAKTQQAFPGVTLLPAGIQAALISLVYNRGESMGAGSDEGRREMRAIQRAVRERNLLTIFESIGSMVRLWKGTDIERGMAHRRHAEQALIFPYVQPFLKTFAAFEPFA